MRNSRALLRCMPRRPAAARPPATRYPNLTRRGVISGSIRTPWYRDLPKIASVVALVSGATAAVYKIRRHLEIVPYTNRTHLVVISRKAEHELWASLLAKERKMWASRSQIVDPLHPDSVRVRLIAEKIVAAAHRTLSKTQRSHLDGIQWEVILLRDETVNAMCFPVGTIVVYTGALDHFKTDAEIAAIVAHEVGHIIARHTAEISEHKWFPILLRLPFFRITELEADHIGMLLLGAAGFHPRAAHVLFYKLAKLDFDSGVSRLDVFLNPYPSMKKRLQHLSQPKIMEEALKLYREAPVGPGSDQSAKYFSFREFLGEPCNILLTRLKQVLTGRHYNSTNQAKRMASRYV